MTAAATQVPTLIVRDWDSVCSACGRRADPNRDVHTAFPGAGYLGCAIRYAAVELAHDANELAEPGARALAAALRLPYRGRREVP